MKHAQSGQPGVITLPQSAKHEPPASPPAHSRHSQSGPRPPSGTDASTQPALEQPHAKQERRRRARGTRSDSPLKQGASLAPSDADEPPAESPVLGDAGAATPSKTSGRKRRGGKGSRQPSPPPIEGIPIEQPAPAFPSTTPPQTDFAALATHSRSVPPDPFSQPPRVDAWDMPAAPQHADKPKENLSWQQELLRNGSASALSSTRNKAESPVQRSRSRGMTGKDARTSGSSGASSSSNGRARPPLHASVSENGTAAGPSLNWQQELLLQSDATALAQQAPPPTASGLTPARQRRNLVKDSITFGLSGLDLTDEDIDTHASPRRSQPHSRARTQPSSHAATGFSTPTKAQPVQPVEPRYAGPTFHNSPAASSLPMPSFMLRRKVDALAI
ncbi:hypothetical protein Rhopal_002193-T1 [Rhodotorula paludigena]|uniref:Proteophosphoglycan ppg4 n=1 Tax=Rhodotorula paludigena TaxID=86838 RepID=A0AAV5GFB0_9BASI|nr:hypothetical protein Rhopal_002193-T1 [Rhodotorula paludigena]